ncbi:hypothetical protein CMK12_06500 [Candidatus Poribacteria bacterium]|jgi:hypothetical protein|nr:hypothetical protein [Candidatus Poribacteria bacterium]|tara:strand:- start:1454 stop:2053 length:600 start_codon:yes stop_codon:yes gene_type:complete
MENKIALSKITKATTELMKSSKAQATAAEALRDLIEQAETVSKEIQELEIKKDSIAEDLATSIRQQKIDLDLRVKENEEEVLQNILDSRCKTTINPEELEELRETADRASRELEENTQKAVEAALADKEINYKLEKAEEDQKVAVERAESQARIEAFTSQLEAAARVAEDLREQLSAEREAGVKRAEAAGAMTINAGSK